MITLIYYFITSLLSSGYVDAFAFAITIIWLSLFISSYFVDVLRY